MSHKRQLDFIKEIKECYPHFFHDSKVVDFGSKDINGSAKKFFNKCDYIGVDVSPGNNVDFVSECHKFDNGEKYDVVCSFEMLEHDPFFNLSINNMINSLKNNGLMIITAACSKRKEHGTKRLGDEWSIYGNYYRNIKPSDFSPYIDSFYPCFIRVTDDGKDIQFFGIKRVDSTKNSVFDYASEKESNGLDNIDLNLALVGSYDDMHPGPGTFLLKKYSKMGFSPCEQCIELALKMNEWGPKGCEKNINIIYEDILPRARNVVLKRSMGLGILIPNFVFKKLITNHILEAIDESKKDIKLHKSSLIKKTPTKGGCGCKKRK